MNAQPVNRGAVVAATAAVVVGASVVGRLGRRRCLAGAVELDVGGQVDFEWTL